MTTETISLESNDIRQLLIYAPRQLSNNMLAFYHRYGTQFIGNRKKRSGKIWKQLERLGWQDRFIRQLRYRVEKDESGIGHSLQGGLITENTERKSVQIMLAHKKGERITSKNQFLIIPLPHVKDRRLFNFKRNKDNMFFYFRNNKIYYHDKESKQLEYIGVRETKLKPVKALQIRDLFNRDRLRFNRNFERQVIFKTINQLNKKTGIAI